MPASVATRNDFLDYLKGALIFLVVWGHLIQFAGYGNHVRYLLDPLFKAIYTFHMPLFMAVSGFISFRTISRSELVAGTGRRFHQIIVPALCWPVLNLIVVLLWCVFRAETPARGWHEFIKWLPAFRPGLWFLWALFGSTVVVAVLKKFHRDRLEFFAAATVLFLFGPDGANIYLFKYTFPFFCLGYALAKGDQIRFPSALSRASIIIIFTLSIGCYLLWTFDTYVYTTRMYPAWSNLPNIGLRWLAGVVVSAAFVWLISRCYPLAKSATLSLWGRRSLDIYVIHASFLPALAEIDHPLRCSPWFTCAAAPVLAVIFCVTCCLVGHGLGRIPVAGMLLLGQTPKA